jgi:type IV pilus assembly protein PilB
VIDRKFYRGRGCAACNNTGFKGRTGLYEYMPMNDQLRELINGGASTDKIRDLSLRTGLIPLRASGLEKVFGGVTTIEEVIRETVSDA